MHKFLYLKFSISCNIFNVGKLETAKGGMAGLRSIDIRPWNLEPSRSRSQTKVRMETTHEGLPVSTSDVWES